MPVEARDIRVALSGVGVLNTLQGRYLPYSSPAENKKATVLSHRIQQTGSG